MKQAIAILTCVCAIIGSLAFADSNVSDSHSSLKYDDSGTRTLILLRHAKSDKSNMNMPDIERPLEASGRLEAEEMGEYLKKNIDHIDAIYSSPAVRTKQTLEIICPVVGYDYSKVIFDSTLYACSGQHLEQQIRHTDSRYKTVIYVGHNPSITEVANKLQADSVISEVKTCGIVTIDFSDTDWATIANSSASLRFYAKPKSK